MPSSRWLSLALVLTAVASLGLALRLGSIELGWAEVWQAVSGQASELPAMVVRELRLPRALSAFAVGGLLALSGALLQVLLRNPLADPYILGISGGAAVAALLSMLAGLGAGWVTGNAFAGSLISMLLVFGLSHVWGNGSPMRLLLTGVVIAAGWGAVIGLILSLSASSDLQGMLFWLLGDLSRANQPLWGNVVLGIGILLAWPLARALNLLTRGELTAAALGENPVRLRVMIFFLASLLTATAVTMAGGVGFVGLVIPHLLRLAGDSDHRSLLPHCVLLGGSFLVLADTLARTLVAPMQLPVGVITALLGVPAFLFLLARSQRS